MGGKGGGLGEKQAQEPDRVGTVAAPREGSSFVRLCQRKNVKVGSPLAPQGWSWEPESPATCCESSPVTWGVIPAEGSDEAAGEQEGQPCYKPTGCPGGDVGLAHAPQRAWHPGPAQEGWLNE